MQQRRQICNLPRNALAHVLKPLKGMLVMCQLQVLCIRDLAMWQWLTQLEMEPQHMHPLY